MKRLALLVSLGLSLSGCLPATTSETAFLLEQDYLKMTDNDLVAYEQELSDELVISSQSDNGDVSVGIGFGTWGGSTGYGIHADKWLGGGMSSTTRELRSRRNEVRAEMRRRGLLPQ